MKMFRNFLITSTCVAALGFLVASDVHAQISSTNSGQTAQVQGPACKIDFGTTPDCAGLVETVSGTPLDTQFACAPFDIVFGAAVDSPRPPTTFQTDGACPSPDGSMHSSGSPPFATDWWAQFLAAGLPATVPTFSVDVCFIDAAPPVVFLEGYDKDKVLIVSASSTTTGTETLTITAPGISYVRVVSSADPAGLSIDCLDYPNPEPNLVPAVSEWGLIVLTLIGLAAGTILFARRRPAKA